MALTSSIYNHFIIWPSSVTLTFNLLQPNKMFQTALHLLEHNYCAKLFWNPCINEPVMAKTSSIYDHFDLYLTPMILTFNLTEKCFKWHFYSSRKPTVQNYFEIHAQMYKLWPGQAQYMTILTPVTLTVNLPEKNISNGTSPPQGLQLCKILLKSMHKCTSYGPDKLNICPFWPLFDPCDLDRQHT